MVVSERQQGVAALAAARRLDMRAWAVLQPGLCSDPYDLQLNAAEIGDAGAEAILLSVDSGLEAEDLREMIDMACEIDLLDVPTEGSVADPLVRFFRMRELRGAKR